MQHDGQRGTDGRLVVPVPGTANGAVAAHVDLASGAVVPTRTSFRRREVRLDERAWVHLLGRRGGADLSVERFNGWRRAVLPLLTTASGRAFSQSPEVLETLAAQLEQRRPKGWDEVAPVLRAQARHVADAGDPRRSPVASKVGPGGGAGSALGALWG
jgi:hypothetical protein